MLTGDPDGEPLPHRTVAVKRRDPGTWRIGEDDLRAIEIACAGWHNIHVIGPDGHSLPQYGRIAQALLPDLAGEAARETTMLHGVADLMAPWTARITEPPLRVPHYTASRGAVAGSQGPPRRGQPRAQRRPRHRPADRVRPLTRPTPSSPSAPRTARPSSYRYTPVEHTIRMPARFRLMVDNAPRRARHPAASRRETCSTSATSRSPATCPPTARCPRNGCRPAGNGSPGRRRSSRARPPHLIGSRAAYDTTSRRVRAVAQTVAALDGRRQIDRARTSPKPNASSNAGDRGRPQMTARSRTADARATRQPTLHSTATTTAEGTAA